MTVRETMQEVLIKGVKDVKEMIEHILVTKETVIEHIAYSIDVTPAEITKWYQEQKWPSKKTLLRLSSVFCQVCIEQHAKYNVLIQQRYQ